MELGTAFQAVLFVLPGFLALQIFLFFVPTRRSDGDIAVVAWSIAASAGIWLLGGLLVVIASPFVAFGYSAVSHHTMKVDLWANWLRPALTHREITPQDLTAGLVLCILGLVLGLLGAVAMRTEGGRVRAFNLAGRDLRFDLNPRVWSWFFQEPTKGALYRVTLKSGRYLVGQIGEYSADPDDDIQEVVMRVYSEGPIGGTAEPVYDSLGLLISRDGIEKIELLRKRIAEDGTLLEVI